MLSLWQVLDASALIFSRTATLRDSFLPLFFKVSGEVWVSMGRTRKCLWKLSVVASIYVLFVLHVMCIFPHFFLYFLFKSIESK